MSEPIPAVAELRLVTTDERAEVLGTIRLDDTGQAVFDGSATCQRVFQSLQRAHRDPKPSDADIFAIFANGGWSNGPVKLVPIPAPTA